MIIKQTKESVETELIEVPILENWSSRFWSKRSKRESKKRGQTGTRGRDALAAKHIIKMKELSRELIRDSLDLIPWLCALHPEKCKKKEVSEIELTSQIIPLYGSPAKPKSVMSRMMYRTKVGGARGKRGYVAAQALVPKETITHPRHYRSFRRKKRKALNAQTYRAPNEIHFEYRNLREQTARNIEIRRFRHVLRLLSKQKESWSTGASWHDFLKQLENVITNKEIQNDMDELYKMSELLMSHDVTSDLWRLMQWFRERKLGVGLRLNEQENLDGLLESRPYVTSLYGNYLILLLVALARKYQCLRIDQLQGLWLVVKSWHLKQIGFYLRDVSGASRPKFDVRAIWSNLNKRAAVLTQLPLPVQSAVRHGRLLVAMHEDVYDYWVFIEDEYDTDRLCSGLWIGRNPLALTSQMKWAESDNREIASHASNIEIKEVHDLLVCKMEGVVYIWLYGEGEWNLQGELVTISRKSSAITGIRGMQVRPTPSGEAPDAPLGVSRPSDMAERVREEMSDIAQLQQHIFGVRCCLGLESGMYTISFESNGEQLDSRVVNRTSDMLSILRRPLVEGIPLQSSQDPSVYMTWNPYEDIDYEELQLIRPYVERKTPFIHVRVPLPLTSEFLLEQSPVETSITISHDENECPLVDGSASTHGHCWRIKSETSDQPVLEDVLLSDIDVSSLINSGEVFLEGQRCKLNIAYVVDPAERRGIVFRESKRIARNLGLKPLTAGAFLDLDSEHLQFILTADTGSVQIGVYSSVTGEKVRSGALIPSDGDWLVKDVIEEFKDDTEQFLTDYFGAEVKPSARIVNYREMLVELKRILKRIRKGLPPLG
ncbi:MAG: hypothetical protein ACXABY_19605 [Candidatus Thorarchaeota archaeon]